MLMATWLARASTSATGLLGASIFALRSCLSVAATVRIAGVPSRRKRFSRETLFMSQLARGPGCPHAEVEAFRDAEACLHRAQRNLGNASCEVKANGVADFSETTIYSTLEPCHRGPGKPEA